MAKVTGKYQITLPKAVVDGCGIRIGEELQLYAVGEAIHIKREQVKAEQASRKERLARFDKSTIRQNRRQENVNLETASTDRGWKREDLYTRGSAG